MFLLIQECKKKYIVLLKDFTFHNVSINTVTEETIETKVSNFTFHNVSINTPFRAINRAQKCLFTFHNVSINTAIPVQSHVLLF